MKGLAEAGGQPSFLRSAGSGDPLPSLPAALRSCYKCQQPSCLQRPQVPGLPATPWPPRAHGRQNRLCHTHEVPTLPPRHGAGLVRARHRTPARCPFGEALGLSGAPKGAGKDGEAWGTLVRSVTCWRDGENKVPRATHLWKGRFDRRGRCCGPRGQGCRRQKLPAQRANLSGTGSQGAVLLLPGLA